MLLVQCTQLASKAIEKNKITMFLAFYFLRNVFVINGLHHCILRLMIRRFHVKHSIYFLHLCIHCLLNDLCEGQLLSKLLLFFVGLEFRTVSISRLIRNDLVNKHVIDCIVCFSNFEDICIYVGTFLNLVSTHKLKK